MSSETNLATVILRATIVVCLVLEGKTVLTIFFGGGEEMYKKNYKGTDMEFYLLELSHICTKYGHSDEECQVEMILMSVKCS